MEKKEGELLRELGLKEGLSVGLGTMIGAGIFVLSALAAERAGRAAAVSYLIAGSICLLVAMVVSELATGMPRAGGSYTFIAQALGPLAGSVVGPANWLGLVFATGFYLIAFGHYLASFVPISPWLAATASGLLFTWLNYRGAKTAGSVQTVVVVVLVAILVLFIALGLRQGAPLSQEPFAPHGWLGVVGVVGLIIVSFTGFEKISTIAEEIKDPGRNLPLAIMGSVVIASLLYALILFVGVGLVPEEAVSGEGLLVDAAQRIAGAAGRMVMLVAALLATLSSANAAIMASSRISFGMGRDGVLPKWFNHAHPVHNTPSNSILVTGGLGTALALTGSTEILAEISSVLFMVSYALLCASVVVMRGARRSWYRPAFRVPLYPLLPVVAAALCLSVILTMEPISRAAGMVLVGLSLVWYWVWVRKRAVVPGEVGPLWQRERPLEGVLEAAGEATHRAKNEVLIPLFDGAGPGPLLSLATGLALTDEQAVVDLLEVQLVPDQTPLEQAQALLAERTNHARSWEASVADAASEGVPVRTLRRAAHGLASGVLAVVEGRPTVGLVLMSWNDALSASLIYGSPVKEILEKAPCDVGVLRSRGDDHFNRILVPVGGGPHARMGLRLASRIAQRSDVALTALRVLTPRDELDVTVEMDGLRELGRDVLGAAGEKLSYRVRVSSSVLDAIVQEAEEGEYDLLVIGASNEWLIKSLLVGALPDAVADRVSCSVLMVRRHEPVGISAARRIVSSLRGWR